MTWVKMDDMVPENPKFVDLSDRAYRIHWDAICYCNRRLTDGHIRRGALRALGATPRYVAELIDAGLWEPSPNGTGGYMIHDYLDYQPSKTEVEERRKKRSDAGAKGARARWHTA